MYQFPKRNIIVMYYGHANKNTFKLLTTCSKCKQNNKRQQLKIKMDTRKSTSHTRLRRKKPEEWEEAKTEMKRRENKEQEKEKPKRYYIPNTSVLKRWFASKKTGNSKKILTSCKISLKAPQKRIPFKLIFEAGWWARWHFRTFVQLSSVWHTHQLSVYHLLRGLPTPQSGNI